jgi:hypothetical protein
MKLLFFLDLEIFHEVVKQQVLPRSRKKEPTRTRRSLRESSAHVHCGNVLLMRTIEELVYLGQLLIKQAFKREGLKGDGALRPGLLVSVMQYRPFTHPTRICATR